MSEPTFTPFVVSEPSQSASFAVRLWMDTEDITTLTAELCQASDLYALWSARADRAWAAYQADSANRGEWNVCSNAKTAAENLLHICAARLYRAKAVERKGE